MVATTTLEYGGIVLDRDIPLLAKARVEARRGPADPAQCPELLIVLDSVHMYPLGLRVLLHLRGLSGPSSGLACRRCDDLFGHFHRALISVLIDHRFMFCDVG